MSQPLLELHDHQEAQPVHLKLWHEQACSLLPLILRNATTPDAPLLSLSLVEITFVNDDTIARVHQDFMGDPTPTDVITFHHGEILISLDTAARQAAEIGESYEREVLRYILHGLLHLCGYDDHTPAGYRTMKTRQTRLRQQIT